MSRGDRWLLRPVETADLEVVAAWLEVEGLGVPAAISHEAWGRRLRTDPRIVCRIAELGGARAGLLRLDLGPDGSAEVSLLVAREHRRRGLGRRLLDLAIAAARQRGLSGLVAAVRGDNAAALAFFRAAGFEETGRGAVGFVLLHGSLRGSPVAVTGRPEP